MGTSGRRTHGVAATLLALALSGAACAPAATVGPSPANAPAPALATPSPANTPRAPVASPPVATPTPVAPSPGTPAPASAAPSPSPAAADPVLVEALAYASDRTIGVFVTNWERVLAGSRPGDAAADRMRVLAGLSKTHAFPSAFGVTWQQQMRALWAFDSLDLAWEATYSGNAGIAYVLQFPATFDLAPIVALLEQRQYARAAHGDAIMYTHDLDFSQPWSARPLAMENVAVLAARHRLVAASGPDALAALLDAGAATGTVTPGLDSAQGRGLALAAAIGSPYGAFFALDPAECRTFSPNAGAAVTAAPVDLSGAHPTLGTLLAFSTEAGEPPVTAGLLFASGAAATADLAGRADLLDAPSIVTKKPYGTSVMALSNGRVAGTVLLFDAMPRDGRPSVAENAWLARDLPFAACP